MVTLLLVNLIRSLYGKFQPKYNDTDKGQLLTLKALKYFRRNHGDQIWSHLNPLTAKLFNLNFHPLEAVSRWRDPQLQVSEKYSDLTKWRSTLF